MFTGAGELIGAAAAGTSFLFAEGTVRPGFAEFLTIQSPGVDPAPVAVSFQAADDSGVPVVVPAAAFVVEAGARSTFNVNDWLSVQGVPTPINISAHLTSPVPVVAERPLYFRSDLAGGVDGGTTVIGAYRSNT